MKEDSTMCSVQNDQCKPSIFMVMYIPNWQHHSNKQHKPKRNPVAIKQSKARLQALKRKLLVI